MSHALSWLPWLPTLCYLAGSLLAGALAAQRWRVGAAATRIALAPALLGCVLALTSAHARPQPAAALLSALIAFLGWIIGDFSQRQLQGEPGQTRFVMAYLLTLGAVDAVVQSRNLALLILAWAASSAALHHLLTFYRDRPAARIAAHKKFLVSRLAEGCLVVAAVLLYQRWGTLALGQIDARAAASASLPPAAGAAATLIAIAVLLKSAQLPLHGWLMQVMEAPTPVSALLHAGVVNLGGYVLIRFAPLIDASPSARTLLVLCGSLTAVLAGLVTLTRITIKVRLAWSTCSQMGLMVLECGLGLHELALLHLLAHALYKAHGFLTSGGAVRSQRADLFRDGGDPLPRGASWLAPLLALPVTALAIMGSAALWQRFLGLPPLPVIAPWLLACGLATLLWQDGRHFAGSVRGMLAIGAGTQLYLGAHWLLDRCVGIPASTGSPLLATWTVAMILALYMAQVLLFRRPRSTRTGRWYDWAYAGFYLDERFTRLTFRLWPLPARPDTAAGSGSAA